MSLEDITNPLQYIELVIASDVRDWSADNRLATIYAIVFGWGDDEDNETLDSWSEVKEKLGWRDSNVERLKKFHEEWKRLREEERRMRLIDADEIQWHEHKDSDGNITTYKVAYSDEMPPTVDAVPDGGRLQVAEHLKEYTVYSPYTAGIDILAERVERYTVNDKPTKLLFFIGDEIVAEFYPEHICGWIENREERI